MYLISQEKLFVLYLFLFLFCKDLRTFVVSFSLRFLLKGTSALQYTYRGVFQLISLLYATGLAERGPIVFHNNMIPLS